MENALADPTAEWDATKTICLVSLFGIHTAPNVNMIEVYYNWGNGWTRSPQLALPGVRTDGTKFYTWAANYGNGFKPGDVIQYYTKLYWTDDMGMIRTAVSNTVSVTLPPKP